MAQDPQDDTQPAATAPQEGAGSALLLKAKAGREDRQARSMSVPKALRLTVAKVADRALDMAMAVIGARTATVQGETLEEVIPEDTLLLLLDGPNRQRAAALVDRALAGGLVQQQTMGTVTAQPPDDTRKLTNTDAAICAPFLEDLLAQASTLPETPQEQALLSGYSFGARVEEARLLLIALDEPAYEVITLTIDVAGGKRQGILTLIMPQVAEDSGGGAGGLDADGAPAKSAAPVGLDRTVLQLDVELRVALTSLTMPLGQMQGFGVGDVLTLDVSAFDQASVQTRDGRKLSRGTLGQIDGVRALQLEHASDGQRAPRRRKSDRAELNLPQVQGDGTGTQPPERPMPEHAAEMPQAGADMLPDLPDLPDISDLPELPDLPDMSDLPGMEDDAPSLPQLNTG